MKEYLNNPAQLLSVFSNLQFDLEFDRWRKSRQVDTLQYVPLKPNYIFVLWKPIYLLFMSIKTYLSTWISLKKVFSLTSLKKINFLWLTTHKRIENIIRWQQFVSNRLYICNESTSTCIETTLYRNDREPN